MSGFPLFFVWFQINSLTQVVLELMENFSVDALGTVYGTTQ